MLDTIEQDSEEESDDELEQGRIVDNELLADLSRTVAIGASENEMLCTESHWVSWSYGRSVLWEIVKLCARTTWGQAKTAMDLMGWALKWFQR